MICSGVLAMLRPALFSFANIALRCFHSLALFTVQSQCELVCVGHLHCYSSRRRNVDRSRSSQSGPLSQPVADKCPCRILRTWRSQRSMAPQAVLHSPPRHQVVLHSPPFLHCPTTHPSSQWASTMWESNILKSTGRDGKSRSAC